MKAASKSKVQAVREELSGNWHQKVLARGGTPQDVFGEADRGEAFGIAKDWLQETSESLSSHRSRGFSPDGYVEFLGVLHAAYIQQDAVFEMHYAITGQQPKEPPGKYRAWKELRELRDLTAGHPNRNDRTKGHGRRRVSIPRQAMTYDYIWFMERSSQPDPYRSVDLGSLLDRYDVEAGEWLQRLAEDLDARIDRWIGSRPPS